MRLQEQLLTSRTQVSGMFALLPLEGIPYSRLSEWPDALVRVCATPAIGAGFAEYRIDLQPGQNGGHEADGEIEHFLFVLDGNATLSLAGRDTVSGSANPGLTREHALKPGSYALLPPDCSYRFEATKQTSILLLRKRYEWLEGVECFAPRVSNESDVQGEVYMGIEGALLQTLVPDEFSFDMAMNIFTFQTGHSLPVTETHVMEHGLYVLAGKGLYFLDDRWMEVEASDFIWMGPFCPQSYYATGPVPTRYIYYKNVNREFKL